MWVCGRMGVGGWGKRENGGVELVTATVSKSRTHVHMYM